MRRDGPQESLPRFQHFRNRCQVLVDCAILVFAARFAYSLPYPNDKAIDSQSRRNPMKSCSQKVAVIIPTYNRANYLVEAIKSALSQDYPEIFVIVVDDGSTDQTKEVCMGLLRQFPNRLQYTFQENRGCASARNKGLSLIDEDIEYVCFLDSDDRLLPGKLTREVNLLHENSDIDFCYSSSILYDEATEEEHLQEVAALGRPEEFALEHFLTNEAKVSAMLYRARLFKKFRFREDLRYNEDSELLQRIAIECRGVYSPSPGCWVRWHAGSKSRNPTEIRRAVLAASLEILQDYPDFYAKFAKKIDRRIRSIRSGLTKELALAGQWGEARRVAATLTDRWLATIRFRTYFSMRGFLGQRTNWLHRKLKSLNSVR